MSTKATIVSSLAAVLLLVPCRAWPEPATRMPVGDAIALELDSEAHHVRLWWNAWTFAYGGLTVGQATAAGVTGDRDTRVDMSVGAVSSLLGVVGMFLSPLGEVDLAAETLDRMPAATEAERVARDDAAVRLRAQAASAEQEGRSLLAHALNVVVAAGSSLVLWKGFDRGASSAATNFASGIAVGELQLWTQPARLLRNAPSADAATATRSRVMSTRSRVMLGWSGRLLCVRVTF